MGKGDKDRTKNKKGFNDSYTRIFSQCLCPRCGELLPYEKEGQVRECIACGYAQVEGNQEGHK